MCEMLFPGIKKLTEIMENKMRKWKNVKDHLPEQHGRYLCYCPSFRHPTVILDYFALNALQEMKWTNGNGQETKAVKYWMELPGKPE